MHKVLNEYGDAEVLGYGIEAESVVRPIGLYVHETGFEKGSQTLQYSIKFLEDFE